MTAVGAGRTSLRIAAIQAPDAPDREAPNADAGQPEGPAARSPQGAEPGAREVQAEPGGSPAARHRIAGRAPRTLDDPCSEGGYDDRCRDELGRLCHLHAEHCLGPDYPCLDLLRHQLAIAFLEDLAGATRLQREQAEPEQRKS